MTRSPNSKINTSDSILFMCLLIFGVNLIAQPKA
uniref:Uncharacterized protein n=1 Tax=Arundo donax TaxID=35708 RepID=A0A0A8ZLV5_ARUDO